MDYNDKNQCIHMSNNNCECNYEYDNYGNIILERYSNGYEVYYKYDDNGNFLGSYDNII